jgi:hypothetical protein
MGVLSVPGGIMHMMQLKWTAFAVALGLSGLFGYFPWRYATEYETFRLDFSPMFATEYCSQFGYFLKTISILTWVGALIGLGYLCYKQVAFIHRKVRQNPGQGISPVHSEAGNHLFFLER